MPVVALLGEHCAHGFASRQESAHAGVLPAALELFGRSIEYALTHEAAGVVDDKARRAQLGTGALDLPGVIKALEDIHYEGWIMVERDSREPDFIQSARNMRAVLRRFGR